MSQQAQLFCFTLFTLVYTYLVVTIVKEKALLNRPSFLSKYFLQAFTTTVRRLIFFFIPPLHIVSMKV